MLFTHKFMFPLITSKVDSLEVYTPIVLVIVRTECSEICLGEKIICRGEIKKRLGVSVKTINHFKIIHYGK